MAPNIVRPRFLCLKGPRYRLEGFERIFDDPNIVIEALQSQPLAAAIKLYTDIRDLKQGIYMGPKKGSMWLGYHAVLVVGHGIEDNDPYYLIENSYGTQWGVTGFGKIKQSLIFGFMRPTGEVTCFEV